MKVRTRLILALGALGFGLALMPGRAEAQFGVAGGTTGAGGMSAAYANPYMNPYINPFLNPYATNQTTSPGDAALYFMAAQQMNGGLGSGRLGGPKAGAGAAAAPAPAARPRSVSNMPGANASRYFNGAFRTVNGPKTFDNRPSRYFPTTGR